MNSKKLGLTLLGTTAVSASALASYAFLIRPWHLRWGATDEETKAYLPGDELVPVPRHVATHAITIHAPVADVWPWLVQVGQTKGGFYSYAWLENLVGCDMHNADRIVPEWQTLRVGDVVWLHPQAPPVPVAMVEPERAIVLGRAANDPEMDGATDAGTWGFYLKALDEKTTRLITRARWDCQPGVLNWLGKYALLEPAHFIMERKMMMGIKARAERNAALRGQPSEVTEARAASAHAGKR